MVLLNEGVEKIRDLIKAELSKGQIGTDNTSPSPTDTGLIAPDSNTLLDLSSTSATGNVVQATHKVTVSIGNGTTYKEGEVQFSDGTSLNRVVFTGVSKTNTEELHFEHILVLEQM